MITDKGNGLVDEERVYTKHYVRWWERWFNPTTVMAIIGAMVWGIQLNFAVMQNTKDLGKASQLQQNMVEVVQKISQQQIRITVIQEQSLDRLGRLELNYQEHATDVGNLHNLK